MSRWDEATRSLSRKVLEQVVRLGTPETNWWTTRSRVGCELRTDPVALYNAVRLLIEEGDVESKALDLQAVRATLRGWMKFPEPGANRRKRLVTAPILGDGGEDRPAKARRPARAYP
jgi:hypothetical protein